MKGTFSYETDAWSRLEDQPMVRASATPPLAFPKALAGTWPAPDEDRRADLVQVQALDGVITFLTTLRHHAARSMRSWESVPGLLSRGWADSQGRMDPITTMANKSKDFVNGAFVKERQLFSAVWHPKS